MATARITVLGCGGSGGVPLVTGWWGACDPANPKNRRTRASIAIESGGHVVVVDTGPDFREQMLRAGLSQLDAVLYTHGHSDHVNGIDELRYVFFQRKSLLPIYGDAETMAELQARFTHLFVPSADGLYGAVVEATAYAPHDYGKPLGVCGVPITPFWQQHAFGRSIGYRLGNFAYSTDVSGLDAEAFAALEGIDTWLVDCGQFGSDYIVVHPNLEVVQSWNDRVGAKRVILTHLTPRADFEAIQAALPEGFEPAYDGMQLDIDF